MTFVTPSGPSPSWPSSGHPLILQSFEVVASSYCPAYVIISWTRRWAFSWIQSQTRFLISADAALDCFSSLSNANLGFELQLWKTLMKMSEAAESSLLGCPLHTKLFLHSKENLPRSCSHFQQLICSLGCMHWDMGVVAGCFIRLENSPLVLSLSFISGFALSITVLNIQCPSQENVAGVIHCMAHNVVPPRGNSMMPRRGQDSAVILHVAIPANIVL